MSDEVKLVRIVKCTKPLYWYNHHVNEIFTVKEENEREYRIYSPYAELGDSIRFVLKDDCKILADLRPDACMDINEVLKAGKQNKLERN